jgi:hypothetical protein
LIRMQMDAYLKKEQINTLFVWVGALEGGGVGGWVRGVKPKNRACLPSEFSLASWCAQNSCVRTCWHNCTPACTLGHKDTQKAPQVLSPQSLYRKMIVASRVGQSPFHEYERSMYTVVNERSRDGSYGVFV